MERNEAKCYADMIMKRIVEDINLFKLSAELYNNNENVKKCEAAVQYIEKQPLEVEKFWNEEKQLTSIITLNDICKTLTSVLPAEIRSEVNSHIDDLIEESFAE